MCNPLAELALAHCNTVIDTVINTVINRLLSFQSKTIQRTVFCTDNNSQLVRRLCAQTDSRLCSMKHSKFLLVFSAKGTVNVTFSVSCSGDTSEERSRCDLKL